MGLLPLELPVPELPLVSGVEPVLEPGVVVSELVPVPLDPVPLVEPGAPVPMSVELEPVEPVPLESVPLGMPGDPVLPVLVSVPVVEPDVDEPLVEGSDGPLVEVSVDEPVVDEPLVEVSIEDPA